MVIYKYNNINVDIIKLIKVWRGEFEDKIEYREDYYYTHIKKDREESRLLDNLSIDFESTVEDLFEYGDIPKDADIYE